jgi:DNA-binding NarL/FixJ family response regulator
MSQAPRLRILIADDHTLFRRGVREVIDEAEDMEVVAEAADGEQAVRLAAQLRPEGLDLVLMDIEMPKLDGIAATRRIAAADPTLPIVMLTVSTEERDLLAAVRAGAVGFLSKSLSSVALVRALRDFHRQGALPMSRVMASRVLGHLRSITESELAHVPAETPTVEQMMPQSLTRRQQEVLDLIARGARDRDIAGQLQLTENTVKKHVKNILHKLGARNRAQAAAYNRESTRAAEHGEDG